MADEEKGRYDITFSPATAKRLADLMNSVRKVGHSRPTAKTLLSALIDAEGRRGKQLEDELLVPFRKADPEAD